MSANDPNSPWPFAGLAGALVALSSTPALAQAAAASDGGSPLAPLTWLVGAIVALWLLGLLFKRSFPRSRWAAAIIFAGISAVAVFVPCGQTYWVLTGNSVGAGFTASLGATVAALVSFFWLRGSARLGASAPAAPQPTSSTGAPAPDVFISYKRDERPDVAAIAQRLTALKLNVWFDAEIRSGTPFDAEIDRKVRAAKCVLVCWSPGAVASDWVRGEATIGRGRGVLCAAMLRPCDLPAPFNLVHADDLTVGIGPTNPGWLAMLDRIGALTGRPGLADYEKLEMTRDPAALGAWIARNPHDPLAETVVARLKALSP